MHHEEVSRQTITDEGNNHFSFVSKGVTITKLELQMSDFAGAKLDGCGDYKYEIEYDNDPNNLPNYPTSHTEFDENNGRLKIYVREDYVDKVVSFSVYARNSFMRVAMITGGKLEWKSCVPRTVSVLS